MIAGTVFAVPVFLLQMHREYTVLRSLADALFVSAVILLGVSGLLFARNDGFFDIFGYSFKFAISNHFSSKGKIEDFADYKAKKLEDRKSPINILFAGLIFLIIAVIFVVVYYATAKA